MLRRLPLLLAAGLLAWAGTGCRHTGQKKISTTPPSDIQAPTARKVTPKAPVDPRERELQAQIESMQEQIKMLSARTEALWSFYGVRMGPKWAEKVQEARADQTRPSDRVRYLEAMKAVLARRLDGLRDEMKIYQEFQASDPSIPRP